jgi:hypothetical protein
MTVYTPRITGWDAERAGLRYTTPEPSCDFCGLELTRIWTCFDCADFELTIPGFPVAIDMVGHWATCDPCTPLVRSRSWQKLLKHVVKVRLAAGCRDVVHPRVRAEVLRRWRELERHLTGRTHRRLDPR